MRAAFFDVGDTLVDERRSPGVLAAASPERLVAAFGEREWQVGLRAVWRLPKSGLPQAKIEVEPDAVVDELTEVPAAIAGWLS